MLKGHVIQVATQKDNLSCSKENGLLQNQRGADEVVRVVLL